MLVPSQENAELVADSMEPFLTKLIINFRMKQDRNEVYKCMHVHVRIYIYVSESKVLLFDNIYTGLRITGQLTVTEKEFEVCIFLLVDDFSISSTLKFESEFLCPEG